MKPKTAVAGKSLSVVEHVYLSFYWFSINFHWGAMLTVLLPAEVLVRTPDAQKTLALGLLAGLGSLVGLVVQPVAGYLSDRSQSSWGRRRPYILGGALVNVAGLLWMSQANSLLVLAMAFFLVQVGNNISSAAYQGYIPDVVPQHQRGAASGYMGAMSMLGTLGSFAVAAFLVRPGNTVSFYVVLIFVIILGAILTLWKVPDTITREDQEASSPSSWLKPLKDSDFRWLSLTRALVMLSLYTMVTFIAYFIKDEIGVTNFVGATLFVAAAAIVGALASALLTGALSDRVGRKGIVCAAGLAMAATFLIFVFSPSWNVILIAGLIFGLGYGAYTSVDWALAVDVLPDPRYVARDLGIWGLASNLPMTIAPVVGAMLLHTMAPLGFGYQSLFLFSGVASLLAAGLVWRIRRTA